MTRRTVNILIAIGGVLVLGFISVVGLGIWFIRSAIEAESSNEIAATRAFDEVLGRFGATGPVLEIRGRELVLLRDAPEAMPAKRVQTIHVLAWNPEEENLTRVALPMWLLRLSDDPIDLTADSGIPGISVSTPLSIRPEDIERYGPTLVIDHRDEDGERVLVWSD